MLVITMIGCAGCSSDLPAITSTLMPMQEDERRLWNRVEEEEQRLDRSGWIYENQSFEYYVNQVARRVIPNAEEQGLRLKVRILKNPRLNAFAYPNGVIYLHTGILARMENEAQLATLLGHELIHATHRHAIQTIRSTKNTAAILTTVQVLLAPLGVYGAMASLIGSVGAMAAVHGYSRNLEAEADREGLLLVISAGYDPSEAPKLFQHLKTDLEEQKVQEPFFFGTHPKLKDRIASYEGLLQNLQPRGTGITRDDVFQEQIGPVILENAVLDLAMGRFISAEKNLGRLIKMDPNNDKARYTLGEVYRQRNNPGDQASALAEYQRAVAVNDKYPSPRKGLGLVYYKDGKRDNAREQFQEYLRLAPSAPDKAYVQQYLNELERR